MSQESRGRRYNVVVCMGALRRAFSVSFCHLKFPALQSGFCKIETSFVQEGVECHYTTCTKRYGVGTGLEHIRTVV